ncbi:sugar phosphate isomerase/epimerase [bacterium]|nr:sugar phosphate isomerase/epimerase [bacterium]
MKKHPLVGFTIEPFQGLTSQLIIATMRAMGIAFVELNRRSLADVEHLSRKLNGMTAAFHLPFYHEDGFDLACTDHAQEINELVAQVNRHRRALRLRHVIVHPPEGPDQSDQAWQFFLAQLKKIELPVALENVFPSQTERYLQQSTLLRGSLGAQWAGLCFDACHFYIAGQDPLQQWHQLHDQVCCVHLSDCLPDADLHLPFGCGGRLPIDAFLSALRKTGFAGPITLEIKPPSFDDFDRYINSYTTTLRRLHYQKYLRSRIRMWFLMPILSYLLK